MMSGIKGAILTGLLTGALGISGCASQGGGPERPGPAGVRVITLEGGACFGACPSYRIAARSDGHAHFTGLRFTAITGEKDVKLTPGGFERFEASLAPYKPAPGALTRIVPGENCSRVATDMPGYEIDWSDGAKLSFYSGCMEHEELHAAVQRAPQTLGIEELLKPRG